MKLEHIALNVSDPAEMAIWYQERLGLTQFSYANGVSACFEPGHFGKQFLAPV